MNELQIFKNPKFGEIRTIEEGGRVLFCGSDIAKALGYKRPNDAISQHCKGTAKRSIGVETGRKANGTPATQHIEMNFIPEGDVYRLAAKSQLSGAEEFESWIFDEVIPTINATGAYMTPATVEELINNPDLVIGLAQKIKTLQTTNAQQNQIIGELKPKADYVDLVLKSTAIVPITSIAKDYGMSGRALNKLLHDLGVQYLMGNQWLLYAKYQAMGYTHSKNVDITRRDGRADIKPSTQWTQKGRLFLYELLKQNDILPTIEKGLVS